MKILKLLMITQIYTILSFSQILYNGPQRELYLQRSNFPTNPFIEVKDTLNAISVLWCRATETNNDGYICSVCPDISFVIIDNLLKPSSGWNFCDDDNGPFPYFGYALYKMNNNRTGDYFFIDFRDCNYLHNNSGYLLADITISLNLNYDGNDHSRYEYNVSSYPHIPINNGDVLKIWEIEHLSPPQLYIPKTDCFPDFWQNCLV